MNKKQTGAVIAGEVLIVLMMLYPPWAWKTPHRYFGHAFFWQDKWYRDLSGGVGIDYKLLLTQWFAVIVCTSVTVFLLKNKK